MSQATATRVIAPARNLLGSLRLPGDKSISHRYALLGGLAHGTTQLENFSTGADPASSGTRIAPDGGSRPLSLPDFRIEAAGEWRSPRSGARYPASWRVRVPGEDLDLRIRPLLADQELDVSFRYWEGAVEIEGTHRGRKVGGWGYVELTGYAGPPAAR